MDFDEVKMQHIIYNLISNALKFTEPGGKVVLHAKIRSEKREVRSEKRDVRVPSLLTPHLSLLVSDTGAGIPPESLPYIFDRFYQADSSRVRHHKSEGSGLGLSIAKWIAEAHDGSISVESEPGVGTTFPVRIPHIDAVSTTESHAITRPRLGLIRRGIPPIGQHRIKP